MNIRTRLTLVFAVMVASILLLFSVTIYLIFSQYRGNEFKQRLSDRAKAISNVLQDSSESNAVLSETLNRIDNGGLYQMALVLYSANGTPLIKEGVVQPALTQTQLAQVRKGQSLFLSLKDDTELLAVPYNTSPDNTLVLAVSSVDRYGYSKLKRLREILAGGWLISLIVVVLAGYLFAGDALKPVTEIIRQVNDISATNINARLRVEPQRDELSTLAVTFNNMLARLEEGFTAQKNFVSYASHELRTPLTAMIGHLEVALMQNRSAADYTELLESLLDEAKSMKQLVNGLLELAYASADASTLTFQPVRVDELLFQILESLQGTHPEYQVNLEFDNIPEDDNELTVSGVEPLLRTAFLNLIDNGCRHSSNHQLTVHIFGNQEIRLRFRDNGPGISEDELPHIFEPFYRSANSINAQTAGRGIGLALTKRIVALHQGRIEINTRLGEGTEVILFLPQQKQ